MPRSKDRRSKFDREVDAGLNWWANEHARGFGEVRRDALYAPFRVPSGAWDMEEQLNLKLRRAKDRGAARIDPIVPIYVYARPPVWTVATDSDWVIELALRMELEREATALTRWARITMNPGKARKIASAAAMSANAFIAAIGVELHDEPVADPVLARIDARVGLAN